MLHYTALACVLYSVLPPTVIAIWDIMYAKSCPVLFSDLPPLHSCFAACFIHTILVLASCILSCAFCTTEICRAQWNFYELARGRVFSSKMTSAARLLTTSTMFVTLTDSLLWTCNSFLQAPIGHIDSTVSVMCSHYSTRQEIILGNQWPQICPIEKLQPSR